MTILKYLTYPLDVSLIRNHQTNSDLESFFVVFLYIMLNLSNIYVGKLSIENYIMYIDENAFDFLMNTFNQQLFNEKMVLGILGHEHFVHSFSPLLPNKIKLIYRLNSS